MQKKLVQIKQFAALAFPSHPDALAHVVDTMTMEQKKGSASASGIFGIQILGPANRHLHQRMLFICQRLRRRIGQIRKQSKVDVRVFV